MSVAQAVAALVSLVSASMLSGCATGYTSALGYRARQAVLHGDVEAFDGLMAEAADAKPAGTFDNPKRTVLTHFMDFGGDDRFFPKIDAWKQKGWVADEMTCAIHRARYRGVATREPAEAERAADVCLDEARRGAQSPDRRWAIEACLDEAPFLTTTATAPLARYLEMVADPTEPYLFREGLLRGMTTLYLQDPAMRRANDPKVDRTEANRAASKQLETLAGRFRAVVAAVDRVQDRALVAGATALGALELERASLALGRSFIAGYAASESPDASDLAWAWVRDVKHGARVARLDALGVYDRRREPVEDAYWYMCLGTKPPGSARVPATSVRRSGPAREPMAACVDPKNGASLGRAVGPFPLEATARAVATSSASGAVAQLQVQRRLIQ